jgi:hypothetical protein
MARGQKRDRVGRASNMKRVTRGIRCSCTQMSDGDMEIISYLKASPQAVSEVSRKHVHYEIHT